MPRNLLLIAAALVLVITITLLLDQRKPPTQADFSANPEVATIKLQPTPDFTFTPINSKTQHKLSDYKGKVVLLNFWASWCAPCIIEFPKFATLAKAYPDKLVVLAISADTEQKDIERFLKKIQHTPQSNFPIVHDKGKAISQDLFQTIRLPETIIIDPEGNMVRKVVGDTDWTGSEMRDYLSSLATP